MSGAQVDPLTLTLLTQVKAGFAEPQPMESDDDLDQYDDFQADD